MDRRARALLSGLLLLAWPALGCAAPRPKAQAGESLPPARSGAEQVPTGLRPRVEALLDRSAPAADWRPLGGDALRILEELLGDPAVPPERRLRAVSAMALLDSPEASARLAAILANPRMEARYRARAAAALGQRGGAQAADGLKRALADADGQIRAAAARALASVGGEESRASLEDRLSQEESPAVREVIQQSLTRLQP